MAVDPAKPYDRRQPLLSYGRFSAETGFSIRLKWR
jgi:hypothetical protein